MRYNYYAVQFDNGRTFMIDRKFRDVAAIRKDLRVGVRGIEFTARITGVFRITHYRKNLLVRPVWAIKKVIL